MTNHTIAIESTETEIVLTAPYDPACPAAAKRIGGKWDAGSKTWRFDQRDRDKVEALAGTIWGWNPTDDDAPTVTIRYTVGYTDTTEAELRLGGRRFAYRPGRDSAVMLADGVIITEGAFPGSAGSVRRPVLGGSAEGVVLEIRDLPVSVARKIADEKGDRVVVIDDAGAEQQALTAERDRLVARLAEIDALLTVGQS